MQLVTMAPGPVLSAPLKNGEACDQPTRSNRGYGPGFLYILGVNLKSFHFYPLLQQFFSEEFTLKKKLDSVQSWQMLLYRCFTAGIFQEGKMGNRPNVHEEGGH